MNTRNKCPEILSPAGNYEKMCAALRFGADACYLAGKGFGMRAAADNFTPDELNDAVQYAHRLGKKIYVTVNILPHEDEYPSLENYIGFLNEIRTDAVIAADMGVISLVRKLAPKTAIHVSTQTSVVSSLAAEEYLRLGASRVVLARELTLEEIKMIRRNVSDELELEAFVHGSMCVSYSGRCLLSNHFTGRDANRGQCTQPCRWNYKLFELKEEKRPDERIPIVETEQGTFIMSSKDMNMIEHIPELVESGIDSFKIEGRMKSAYYTAVTANTYRMALDAFLSGKPFNPAWNEELDSVSHREYHTGFYFDRPEKNGNTVTEPGYVREKSYVGIVEKFENGRAFIVQRNKLSVGEEAELISPGFCGKGFTVYDMRDADGNPIESAPHPKMLFSIPLPFEAKAGDMIRK